ncbi:hypothetical protein PS838_05248 [Pseudomonas fluorescens]|nr:hypothetical protein PS838_05248 [Pseudomonas fluorescens]
MSDEDAVEVFKPGQGGGNPIPFVIDALVFGAEQIMTIAAPYLRLATNNARARLSHWQERKAKEIMIANLDVAFRFRS